MECDEIVSVFILTSVVYVWFSLLLYLFRKPITYCKFYLSVALAALTWFMSLGTVSFKVWIVVNGKYKEINIGEW